MSTSSVNSDPSTGTGLRRPSFGVDRSQLPPPAHEPGQVEHLDHVFPHQITHLLAFVLPASRIGGSWTPALCL